MGKEKEKEGWSHTEDVFVGCVGWVEIREGGAEGLKQTRTEGR